MDETLLALLRRIDTPSVCNAIETAQGKRGFNAFTRGTMLSSDPAASAIVGYARTAKIAALEPPTDAPEKVRSRRMDYYKHMSEGPRPAVAVVEDVDFPDAVGAFWGEINTTVHKGFGLSGALTNGVMRDLGNLADDFPVIAGSIGPSHAFVHVREFGTPVKIFSMAVKDGDLVHADRHGAVSIPADVIPNLEAAIAKMVETEKLVIEPARAADFDFEAFRKAWEKFEAART
ncbi:MAG: RraA family protein [Hyphomicrobiales bacterium]|nr:RraA family protein [Hyphomicrobiales bacterium]